VMVAMRGGGVIANYQYKGAKKVTINRR